MFTDTLNAQKTFTGLGASLYDIWWPEGSVGNDEAFFYEQVSQNPGRVLEVGCGTGRVMMSLLRRGLSVDGLDASSDMLEICREKLNVAGFSEAQLFCSPMQSMELHRSYQNILIPFHSFMILPDLSEACLALRAFHRHLEPGGKLMISLFVPNYKSLSLNTEQEIQWRRRKELVNLDKNVVVWDAVRNHCFEQVKEVFYRFQVFAGPQSSEPENEVIESMKMRWYFPHEFKLMLEQAGFQSIKAFGNYTQTLLNSTHSEMVFVGTK